MGEDGDGPAFAFRDFLLMEGLVAFRSGADEVEGAVIEEDEDTVGGGGEGAGAEAAFRPDGLAGLGIGAGEFGRAMGGAVDGVDVILNKDAGIEVPFEVGLFPALDGGARGEIEEDGAGAGREEELLVGDEERVGGVDVAAGFPRELPLDGGVVRMEGEEGFGGEEEVLIAEGDDGGVAGGFGGGKGEGFTGEAVEDDSLSANVENDAILMDEGRGGEGPFREFEWVVGEEVALPKDGAGLEIEAEGVAFFAEGIDVVLEDGGGGGGTAFEVARVEIARVGMGPEELSCLRVEAGDDVGVFAVAKGEEAVPNDGDGGEARADLDLPEEWEGSGEGFRDGLWGDAVLVGAAPVGPVFGEG